MRVFYGNRDCGAVHAGLLHICKDEYNEACKGCYSKGWVLKDLLVANVVGGASSVVVKRERLKAAGLFDEKLPSCRG